MTLQRGVTLFSTSVSRNAHLDRPLIEKQRHGRDDPLRQHGHPQKLILGPGRQDIEDNVQGRTCGAYFVSLHPLHHGLVLQLRVQRFPSTGRQRVPLHNVHGTSNSQG